jgi:hypothetical protein
MPKPSFHQCGASAAAAAAAARCSVHSARALVLAAARAGSLVHASTQSEGAVTRRCIKPMCRAEVPVPAQMWEGLSPVPADVQSKGASPGADVGGVEPSPGADVGGVEPSPGADVGGVEPSPGADVQSKGADLASHWRLEAIRWYACVDYGASHRRWLLWTGIVSGQEALTFFLRTNLDMETLAQVPFQICTGDWAHRRHICAGTWSTSATSAPGLGLPLPHKHRGLGAPLRCVGTHALASRGKPSASASLPLVTGT